MPRNVAQSTKSCAARISTEPSITPCGGIAIPTAAKMIAAENDAKRVGGQVPDSLLSWNCRRSAISGCQCVPFGVLAKVMRNDE